MIKEELAEILKTQKALLCEDKRRLGLLKSSEYSNQDDREIDVRDREKESVSVDGDENLNLDRNVDQVVGEDKENFDCGNVSNENREKIQEEENSTIKLQFENGSSPKRVKENFIVKT
ncbi:hypothetical protein WA026_022821 [Henosepilachna vigintioctopunctata]|uniref:Uncharacterized protein n=1 Tax=Henosepilachna vigintioctopunctata TaxID=420089 RepID=A0AAW1VFX5_9CUCU